ncbi:MAG: ankyrin repeat domain-containing protein [Panacagrimonas sp.]
MASVSIFISYRREDCAGHAGRLSDRLEQRFGAEHVFRDIEDIAAGEDFVASLHRQVGACDVLLALIGPRWLSVTGADGQPRLSKENDWVRLEIAGALARGARVIPVLLQGARLPQAQELPPDLAGLPRRNAVELRDAQFISDAEALMRSIDASQGSGLGAGLRRHRRALLISVLVLAMTVGSGALWHRANAPDRARLMLRQLGLEFDEKTFFEAVEAGRERDVELFLDAGIDPDATDWQAHTALEGAVANGYAGMAKTLLRKGATADLALDEAAYHGEDAMLEMLLDTRPGQEGLDRALQSAAGAARVGIMKQLLDLGANVNADNGQALFQAVASGSVEALELLLARGADAKAAVRQEGWTPLHEAVDRDDSAAGKPDASPEIIRRLVKAGAALDRRTEASHQAQPTPLLSAIKADRPRAALLLIELGANVHLGGIGPYWPGYSTLMAAADRGLIALLQPLLAAGVKVNARGEDGHTALTLAARDGDAPMATALLRAGAEVDARDAEGLTSLMAAAARDEIEVVRVLLANGAAPDAVDPRGDSALIWLARNVRSEGLATAQALLAAGADRTIRNAKGLTAAMVARRHKFENVADLLETAAP